MEGTMKWLVVTLVLVMAAAPFAMADCREEEADKNQERRCDPRRLSDCEDFVRGRSKYGHNGCNRGEKECRLSERCCTELQKMPRECRCEAVEGMYKEAERKSSRTISISEEDMNQRRRPFAGEGEQRQRLERARALPGLCSIEPSYCEIRPSVPASRIFMPGGLW